MLAGAGLRPRESVRQPTQPRRWYTGPATRSPSAYVGPGPAAAPLPSVSKGLTAFRRSGLARDWPTSRRTSPPSRPHDATARPRAEEMDHRRQQPATATPLCHGPMAAPAVSPGNRGQADPERRARPRPERRKRAAARPFQPAGKPHQRSELSVDADLPAHPRRARSLHGAAARRQARRLRHGAAPHSERRSAPPGQRRAGAIGATRRARVPRPGQRTRGLASRRGCREWI